jgi:ammonium transporter Rh
MITFGVVIGKATQLQLLLIAFWEILFYALNKVLVEKYILASDIGGTMVIHTFGAYFGLAVSMATKDKESIPEEKHENQATAVQADLFSMVGTIFLWIMWPSFNSALGLPGPIQQRAIINTLLSLCCACVTVVLISTALRPHHKIDMEDIQNATLAGGVAVGASANMALFPAGAMAVGVVSGLLSAVGFRYVQGFLKRTIGLHDSCGVHNLHGMPGVFGSLVSCAVAGAATYRTYGAQLANNFPGIAEDPTRTAINQGAHQFAALILTLSLAITTGLIVGMCIRPLNRRDMSKFDDSALFHVPATV